MEDCEVYKASAHPDAKVHLPALRKIREARRAAVAAAAVLDDTEEAQAQRDWDEFFKDRLEDAVACATEEDEHDCAGEQPEALDDTDAVAAVLSSDELDSGLGVLHPFGVGGAGVSCPRI